MEEENSNSSTISLHKPNNMSAESQSLDGALPEVGVPSIDTPESIHEVDGSPQLVGVQVVIAEDSVGVEVKAEVNLTKIVSEKRKRGRPPRVQAKPPLVKKEDDVCFICFDGGSLVLCDRRDCPKAYHPACIKRDEEFFRSKAQWNCGTRIVVPGNFPIGCIPVYLTSFPNTNPRAYNEFGCLRGLNQFARSISNPDTIVVTNREQLKEWSHGEFKLAHGKLKFEPDHGSQISFSFELRCLPSNLDLDINNFEKKSQLMTRL